MSPLKQFKILLIYLVAAEDRNQALELFTTAKQLHRENSFFAGQSVKEVESQGWIAGIGKQLFGR